MKIAATQPQSWSKQRRKYKKYLILGGLVAGMLLNPFDAFAQVLFVNDLVGGNIYSYTTSGTRSTFAAGVGNPAALVFDSAGDLYESDIMSGNITEYKTNGFTSVIGNVESLRILPDRR